MQASAEATARAAALWQTFTAKAEAVGAVVERAAGEADAGRAACFLAERLWLLVPGDALVATLDDALERVAALVRRGTPYVTLMSGPSRTADIERTLTIGVHGPRELVIVVVGEEEDGSTNQNADERR